MNTNKLFSDFSLKKIWDKLLQHDKAMNSTLLILTSGNWVEQEDGTFTNTVPYSTFKDTDKLTVDLYDDGTITETALSEYEVYIDNFNIINGALVATANTKPTQTMTIVVKGDFESSEATVSRELLEQCFQSVSNGKALVASAITDKKVATDATATFEEMAKNISEIALGSGNATAPDVLTGKTFTNDDGIEYTGSMTNNGSISKTITPSTNTQTYTVPKGYHDGTGIITVNAAPTSLINGDATAANVLSGKTFFSDSYTAKTGTLTINGAKTASLNCGGSYTIPAGYHNGSGKVTANSLSSQTSATAAAADIASGKTAWVNGKKITGTRPAAVKTASGTVNLSVPKESTKSTIVKFPTPFESIPTVTAVVDHAIQNGVADIVSRAQISTSQITKSSFVLSIKNTTSATLECKASWSAQA